MRGQTSAYNREGDAEADAIPTRRGIAVAVLAVAAALAVVVAVSPAGAAGARNVPARVGRRRRHGRRSRSQATRSSSSCAPPSAAERCAGRASAGCRARRRAPPRTAALGRLTGAGLVLEVRARCVKTVDAVVARVRYDRRARSPRRATSSASTRCARSSPPG